MQPPKDLKGWLDSMRPVSNGVAFGIIIGTVVFALTQNALWLGMGIALGIVVGAAFQANRR